jgi:SAM-dependent methyltransferase
LPLFPAQPGQQPAQYVQSAANSGQVMTYSDGILCVTNSAWEGAACGIDREVTTVTENRTTTSSATTQGELWSAGAQAWSEVQERFSLPLYEAVFDKLGVHYGTRLLDVGCGAGLAASLAAERGALVSGFDASDGLLQIAKKRVPSADFRQGDIESLPYPDDEFDAVTGFNSFQFAATPVNALREARRVTKPGGSVVVANWGRRDRTAYIEFLISLLPPPPPGAPAGFALSDPGGLEGLARGAGLEPLEAFEVDTPFAYPDLQTALRGLLSAGPAIRAIRAAGEERVRQGVTEVLASLRQGDDSYRMETVVRYLISRA